LAEVLKIDARRHDMKAGKILVPLDGSPLSEAALPAAIDAVAQNPAATLLLLRAAEATTFPGGDPVAGQVAVVREAEEYLENVAARLRAQGVKNVKTSVWYGPPAPAIVEAAQVNKADLVIMTTHGRSGLGRLVLGSVAESVLRGTRTPILLLRAEGAPVQRPEGAARATKEPSHV
jgi:nucleotide-binding universal stress UspA family protein